MRNLGLALALVATPLTLIACSGAEDAPAEAVDTRTPEQRVDSIMSNTMQRGICGRAADRAEVEKEAELGEFSAAGMNDYDAYYARRRFNESVEGQISEARDTAKNDCYREAAAEAGPEVLAAYEAKLVADAEAANAPAIPAAE